MRFIGERDKLLSAISTVIRAVPTKGYFPMLSGIFMEASGDGLRLRGTDLDMTIEIRIPAEVEAEGRTVIPAKFLADIVRHMSGDTVLFEIGAQEEGVVRISCGKAVFELNTMNPAEFPEFPEVEAVTTLTVSGQVLSQLIAQTAFAAAKEDPRTFLTGALIEAGGRMVLMAATDTFRLSVSKAEIDYDGNPVSSIVPRKTLIELGRIIGTADLIVKVGMSEKQVSFDLGDTRIASRVILGRFPDYKQIIPTWTIARVRVDRLALIEAIERASLLSKDSSDSEEGTFAGIRLSVEPGRILVRGNRTEVGGAQDEVECEMLEGDQFEVPLRSRYILEGLRAIGGEKVLINFSGVDRPVMLRREDNDACLYLVAPMTAV